MSTINVSSVTTVPSATYTGIFDVLMEAVNQQIYKQWEANRITGTDYANVYLGAMQTVLQQSVQFALNAETAGLQADEVRAGTARANAESAQKVNLTAEQVKSENKNNEDGGVIDKQIDKLTSEINLTDERRRTEETNTVDPTGGAAKDKKDLIAAQTLGFANNTKQSLIKSMLDGYSTNLAIAGVANVPEATRDGAIDQLAQDILNSLNSAVAIQATAQSPDPETA